MNTDTTEGPPLTCVQKSAGASSENAGQDMDTEQWNTETLSPYMLWNNLENLRKIP